MTDPTGTDWGQIVDWIKGLINDADNGSSEGGQALEDCYDSLPEMYQGVKAAFTATGEYLSSSEAIKAYLQTGGTVLLVCAGPTREFGPEITYYATLIEGKAYLYAYPATQVTENVVDMYQKTPIRTYGGFLYELKKNSSDLFEKLLGK